MRARPGEVVIVLAAAILITVVMTWPLAIRAGSAGRIDSGDGQLSIWNVAWVARTLVVDPRGLFDTNIFYPHRGTLAYSETNLGAGLLAVPFYWASGGNPYLAHNGVVLLVFVLALTGTYSLVRHLTGHPGAAAVAAVAYAFCPYVFSHIPHIQLLMTAGLPYSLLALHRYVERQSVGRVCVLALALTAQALSCGYYGIFAGLLVGLGIVFYGVSRGLWRRWPYWAGAVAAAALSIAIVLPFFWPYVELQQRSGFARTLADARRWSAMWRSYAASSAWGHRWVLPYIKSWGEVLYPGTVATVLGLAGLVGWRRGGKGRPGQDHILFYGTIGILAFWSSFGPDAGLYAWLHNAVPVFSWLRAPSRLGLVVVLALAVLGGFAIVTLLARTRRPVLVSTLLVLVTMADLFVAPLYMVEAKPLAPAYDFLARWPRGPVAEFPFFSQRIDFPRHTEYMLNSTAHWRPLVNGYSDFIPPDFRAMVDPLSSFPTAESFTIMSRLRVVYVIFHLNLYDPRAAVELKARIAQYRDYLRPIRLDDSVWLFQIVAWPSEQ